MSHRFETTDPDSTHNPPVLRKRLPVVLGEREAKAQQHPRNCDDIHGSIRVARPALERGCHFDLRHAKPSHEVANDLLACPAIDKSLLLQVLPGFVY